MGKNCVYKSSTFFAKTLRKSCICNMEWKKGFKGMLWNQNDLPFYVLLVRFVNLPVPHSTLSSKITKLVTQPLPFKLYGSLRRRSNYCIHVVFCIRHSIMESLIYLYYKFHIISHLNISNNYLITSSLGR